MGAEITERTVAQEKRRNGERTEKTEKLKRLIEDELSSPFDLRYSVSPVSPCPPHPPFPSRPGAVTISGMRGAGLSAVAILVVLGVRPGGQSSHPIAEPDSGVAESLAQQRSARISRLRYDLSFSIPLERGTPIAGRVTIAFTLDNASEPLALDFDPNPAGALRTITRGGEPVGARTVNGHIVLPPSALRRGENIVSLEFVAGDAPLNRNDDFLYTIFVPAL